MTTNQTLETRKQYILQRLSAGSMTIIQIYDKNREYNIGECALDGPLQLLKKENLVRESGRTSSNMILWGKVAVDAA